MAKFKPPYLLMINLAIMLICSISGVLSQTMYNTELIRRISPNQSDGMITSGDTLFYSDYDWLVSADISDPLNPVFLDTLVWAWNRQEGHFCRGLSIKGNHVYGATDYGLLIVDVSNPASMRRDTIIEILSYSPFFMTYTWNDLVLIRDYSHLYVLDAADPVELVFTDTLDYQIPTPIAFGPRMVFLDSVMFTGLDWFKYTQNGILEKVHSYPLERFTGSALDGENLYIVRAYNTDIYKLYSDLTHQYIGSIDAPEGIGYMTDINIIENYAYIICDQRGALNIFDISDPVNPSLIATFSNSRWGAFLQMIIRDDYVYLSSIANGLMLVKTNLHGVKTNELPTPASLSIAPAYPNPFSGSTTITYSLHAQEYITLEVYSTLGQHVRTLYNGTREPGVHTAQFNASGVPAGMYRIALRSGEGVKTRTVVVR